MIAIIDYGMGNLRSVHKAFERLGINAITSSNIEEIKKATKIVLPGVGHFEKGMQNLKKLNLIELLNEKVLQKKVPVLGICLGMQLLTEFSEEGFCSGLGWINAQTKAFKFAEENNDHLRIPHMGWNHVLKQGENPLLRGHDFSSPFYFVHSYFVECHVKEELVASTVYGIKFTSIVNKGNIFGTQFHPEKSHQQGLKLLKNFAEIK